MSKEEEPEYSIIIEFDDFLTRFDLEEILSSIDRIIEDEFLATFEPEFHSLGQQSYQYPYWYRVRPNLSYVGITAVGRGSINLTIIASAAVAKYVSCRFKREINMCLLAEQLERSGRLAGDILHSVVAHINDWAEKYVPKQREMGGKIKNVRVERRHKEPTQPGTEAFGKLPLDYDIFQ